MKWIPPCAKILANGFGPAVPDAVSLQCHNYIIQIELAMTLKHPANISFWDHILKEDIFKRFKPTHVGFVLNDKLKYMLIEDWFSIANISKIHNDPRMPQRYLKETNGRWHIWSCEHIL